LRLTEEELVRWGRRVGQGLEPPVVLALRGPLGAGKSVLARAVARGAGVLETMPSPTFNLLFRYEGADGITVTHLDLYRIPDPADLWELGWEELAGEDEIVIIEWPERAGSLIPPSRWDVDLQIPEGAPTRREVAVTRVGTPGPLPGFPIALDRAEDPG
jgi:tRNA threonylcarbamoyl adenosine modification protein YjeE